MPASFLQRSTQKLLTATRRAFGEDAFREGGKYVWLEAEAGTGEFVTPVCCSITQPRRKADSITGVLDVAAHDIVIHLDQSTLPWLPLVPDATMLVVATALEDAEGVEGVTPDTTDSKTYLVKSVSDPLPGTTAIRIMAALHGGEG